jgi:uncharacterized membrane protein
MVKNSEVVSYVVFSSFCLVVAVVVELAVVEEGVVLRRGSLVLAPSEEKSTVVLVPLRYQIYTNSLAPTSWKDS